ncbi:MAG: hypothetical protein SGJ19_03710, partial [Planctomycetia bacterium]|nr:hypothetical protein [Planctomycetia bacterium]
MIVLVCLELKPAVRQPIVELADRRGREVGQQLRQVQLRVDVVAAGGAGETAQDGGGLAATSRCWCSVFRDHCFQIFLVVGVVAKPPP